MEESGVGSTYTLLTLFQDGGAWMYPLVLCSLFAFGIIIAKAYTLWAARRRSKSVLAEVETLVRAGKIDEAVRVSAETAGPVAAILYSGLKRVRAEQRTNDIEKGIQTTGVIELGFLERGLTILATISNVAPLLGFLGTVAGMISAFGAIAAAGQVEAALVAEGIKIALITTAAGLIIAVPVNVAYNYFVTRIDKLIMEMEEGTSHVMNLIWDMERPGGPRAALVAGPGVPRHGHIPATGSVEGMGTPDRGAAPDSDHQP
ncbi:MAG TPA: MotA/TolQ/ExbB proton channel family protein [Longimicrobiales bacterium]|nr:MotA/TolQ/ExbB proton channel family protein [Longimicrobiales bacterium]